MSDDNIFNVGLVFNSFNEGLGYEFFESDNTRQNEIIHGVFNGSVNSKMYLKDYNIYEDEEDECEILEIKILGGLNKKDGQNCRKEYTIKLTTLVEKNFCVGATLSCNCRDFLYRSKQNDTVCKHITFILCKIAGIFDEEYFRTKILAAFHTEYIFNMIRNKRLWMNSAVSIKYLNDYFKYNYKEIKGEVKGKSDDETEDDDICYICYEDLIKEKEHENLSCPECFNKVHEECMKKWLTINKSCVFCRSDEWINYDMETLNCKITK
jgi:hypothetical protein